MWTSTIVTPRGHTKDQITKCWVRSAAADDKEASRGAKDDDLPTLADIRRRSRLGGLLKSHSRQAA